MGGARYGLMVRRLERENTGTQTIFLTFVTKESIMTCRAVFWAALFFPLLFCVLPGAAQGAGNNLVFVRNGDVWIVTSDGANLPPESPLPLTVAGQLVGRGRWPAPWRFTFSAATFKFDHKCFGRITNRSQIANRRAGFDTRLQPKGGRGFPACAGAG
jgi:hypothetical protein